jgi:signal transduction histidine kinase
MLERSGHTLRTLAIGHLLAFGLGTLIIAAATFAMARYELRGELDQQLQNRAYLAIATHRKSGRAAMVRQLDGFFQQGSRLGYRLIGPAGELERGPKALPPLAPGWGSADLYDPDEPRVDPFRTYTVRLDDGSMLSVLTDSDVLEEFDGWFLTFIGLSIVLLIGAAYVGNRLLQNRIRQRLIDVTATAHAIIDGDLGKRIPLRREFDDFHGITTTINAMLDRIQRSMEEVRLMSSYIAHDLRTPLAELANDLWRRRTGPMTVADCEIVLAEAARKCEDINRLFSDILQIGEVDARRVREMGKAFDLSELTLTLAEDHVAVAEDDDHALRFEVDPGITLFGVREMLAQVLVNLIENALRHTRSGTTITVSLRQDQSSAVLAVADNGASLPPSERTSLLEENRRSASGEFKRKAIGLKLVRAVVIAHGGTIALIDNRPGLLVEIVLPTAIEPVPQ